MDIIQPSSKTTSKMYDPKHTVEGREKQLNIRISNSLQQRIKGQCCTVHAFRLLY